MSRNAAFRQKVAGFARKCETNMEEAARILAANLLRSVVLDSPVDTGRFRGNWFVQYDKTPIATEGTDKGGGRAIERGISKLKNFKLGMPKIFILNHLPYSIELEYGHSKQAPSPPGIVRLAVQRFDSFMKKVKEAMR